MYACWVAPLFVLSILGVLYSSSFWGHMLSAIMSGIVWNQCGLVGHDIGHCGMTGDRSIDKWIALLVGDCLTGISMGWWRRSHNVHHIACNSIEYDPDLQYIPLFAVTSKLFLHLYSYFHNREMPFDGIARKLVAHQQWTFYPVMAVARVNLFAQSILVLIGMKYVPNRWLEIAGTSFFYCWLSTLLSYLPTGHERFLFLLQLCCDWDPTCAGLSEPFSSPIYQG